MELVHEIRAKLVLNWGKKHVIHQKLANFMKKKNIVHRFEGLIFGYKCVFYKPENNAIDSIEFNFEGL